MTEEENVNVNLICADVGKQTGSQASCSNVHGEQQQM
jgi:hypothetical protein